MSYASSKNKTNDIESVLSQEDTRVPFQNKKATINVSKLVKQACSIYMTKGRVNSTASKLIATKSKCIRVGR